MSLRLSVQGDDPVRGLEELSDWLDQEPELRHLVTSAGAAPTVGELGALSDALVVAVGSGGALSVLAASLKTFLTIPRRSDLRIVLWGPGDRKVEIDAKRVSHVEALIHEALGQVR